MPGRRLPALVAAGLLALGAAGCGNDEDSANDTGIPTDRQESVTATPEATAEAAKEATAALKDTSKKPAIPKPSGQPPAELQIQDIVTGKGPKAKKGDQISVQYVGVNFSNGQEFDASWDRGEPFQFELGGGRVIPGWDEGLVGMREGGRRQLTIPPDMAYGPQGSPPVIGPDETLVFVVDMEQIG